MNPFLFFALLISVAADVTVLNPRQSVYDRSPKLRIKGSGFEAEAADIIIEMTSGSTTLRQNKDFSVTKDDDGLILKLMAGRKWANLEGKTSVPIVLNAVKFDADPSTNLLSEPSTIANVIATPTVEENTEEIYQTATNKVTISGTGFKGAKKIDLYFKPALYAEIGYEIVSSSPFKDDVIVLRLRHGYQWRKDVGDLLLVGIDTGGGIIKLNQGDGVVVGKVVENLEAHEVSVVATATEQLIYYDEGKVFIKGTGFNSQGLTLKFGNNLLGKGVNYTTKAIEEKSIQLNLVPGSFWRMNVESLPGYLTLLAVDNGEGFVSIGAMNSMKGKDIATVFERPQVYSSNTKLYRTHSHQLIVKGAGFTKYLASTELVLDPPLVVNEDYTLTVNDRTELVLTLRDGKSWGSKKGPLIVTKINSRGDENGWIDLPGDGIHIAEIVDDNDASSTGGVEIYPSGSRVYQSAKSISVSGSGFVSGLSLVFEPILTEGTDYDVSVSDPRTLVLTLKEGKSWRAERGPLIVKSVKIDSKAFNLGGNDGIRVANVFTNPVVSEGSDNFHETQSKVIAITGHGFTNEVDLKINLRPTLPAAFKILTVLEDTIRIQLLPGFDWLPTYVTVKDGKKVPLTIVSIDTGAGVIEFKEPVVIGFVIEDREGVICDDSCEFAFDGVCDDGSNVDYDDQNGYEDDDAGGYYADDDSEGEGSESSSKEGSEGDDEADDDYYSSEEYQVSACVAGTDCTDCGGVDPIIDYKKLAQGNGENSNGQALCSNTCKHARDGVCDDPRGGEETYCELGTDCQDCGPVGMDNFTKTEDDDGWWDDDDDYWVIEDDLLEQSKGPKANPHQIVKKPNTDSAPSTPVFLSMLEAMVYTTGVVFFLAACYIGWKYHKGESVPCAKVFDSELAAKDMEAHAPGRRLPITPDVIRT